MYQDITGIILSGGKSLRMGTNKSFLDILGNSAIERTVDLMNSLFSKVLLITNAPELYKNLDVAVCQDIHRYKGPLAGSYSGLLNSTTDRNFIISCDMPLITEDIIRFIAYYNSDRPIVITNADGYNQQLCGVYSKACLPYIDRILSADHSDELRAKEQKERKCKIMHLVDLVRGTVIDIEKEYDLYKPNSFLNMNKPEDYKMLLELINSR